jgi:HAD superfamily hydrolase (TIGR01490 family)
MAQKFAVFDIDGTLIRWQLYHAIVSELAKSGYLAKDAEAEIHQSRMQWKARSHSESFKEYEGALVHTYHTALTQLRVEDYLRVVDRVFEEYKDQVYTYTRDLLRSLKEQDYLLFTISGSQAEVIEKLATYYGFDAAVGNTYERKNGRFTGNHAHVVENKADILKRLVKEYGADFKDSVGVGDSEGDIELLHQVEQPTAFNPSKKLFEVARKQRWKIVVERKNMVYELRPSSDNYLLEK